MTTPAPPVLMFAAHQDDIELSLIAPGRELIKQGHDVHAMVLTTGQNSAVRTQLGLDVETFVAARDDEYRRAARYWGVLPQNIHIGLPDPADPGTRVPDGALTADLAATMIAGWLDEHPDGWVKGHTWRTYPGRHADHIAAGAGALLLLQAGSIIPNGLRCYVEPYGLDAFKAANPAVHIGLEHVVDTVIMQGALDQYKRDEGGLGLYWGIGYRSVKAAIDLVRSQLTSFYHVP